MNFNTILLNFAIFCLPVLFAITVHEAAHGYAARYFGDPTAALLGRITLNPLRHIDPIGTIAIPILLYVSTSGAFLFGYAKPVPVRFDNLRNPKQDMIWVAFAGPASNLAQAFLWGFLFYMLQGWGVTSSEWANFLANMCRAGVLVNIIMFVFNLFPVPPLDGGRVLVGLLPQPYAQYLARIEPWGFFLVMALVLTGVINQIWMQPLMSATNSVLAALLWPFQYLLS